MTTTATQEHTETAAKSVHSAPSSQSAFLQHLASYPAVSAVAGLVASSPLIKAIISNAVPVVHVIHDRTRPIVDPLARTAEPTFKRVDKLGDRALSAIDGHFPVLKSVQPADIIDGAEARISSARNQAQTAVDERIVKPLSGVASAAREQYVRVYDSQGKLIATTLNSRIAPLNDRIEGIIVDYLPGKADTIPARDGSQLERSYRLAWAAGSRAYPLAESLETSTRTHIVDLYSKKLSELSPDKPASLYTSLLALVSTGRELAHEGAVKAYGLISSTRAGKSAEHIVAESKERVVAVVPDEGTFSDTKHAVADNASHAEKIVSDATAQGQRDFQTTAPVY